MWQSLTAQSTADSELVTKFQLGNVGLSLTQSGIGIQQFSDVFHLEEVLVSPVMNCWMCCLHMSDTEVFAVESCTLILLCSSVQPTELITHHYICQEASRYEAYSLLSLPGIYSWSLYKNLVSRMQVCILQNLCMSEWKCVMNEGLSTRVNKEGQEVYVLLNQRKIKQFLGKYLNTVVHHSRLDSADISDIPWPS